MKADEYIAQARALEARGESDREIVQAVALLFVKEASALTAQRAGARGVFTRTPCVGRLWLPAITSFVPLSDMNQASLVPSGQRGVGPVVGAGFSGFPHSSRVHLFAGLHALPHGFAVDVEYLFLDHVIESVRAGLRLERGEFYFDAGDAPNGCYLVGCGLGGCCISGGLDAGGQFVVGRFLSCHCCSCRSLCSS